MQAQTSASPAARSSEQARPASDRPSSAALPREVWIRRCAVRLLQLRPRGEPGLVTRIADELWLDVSRFNPEIAAELEHDSGDSEY